MFRRLGIVLLSALIGVGLPLVSASVASPLDAPLPPPPPKPISAAEHNPKLESILEELAKSSGEGLALAQSVAAQQGITLEEHSVRVIIEPEGADPGRIDRGKLESLGAVIEASSKSLLLATVPLEKLQAIAREISGISYIRLPSSPLPAGEARPASQGLELTGARALHEQGITGRGVVVAIIDVGFEGLAEATELPSSIVKSACTRDYSGLGLESGSPHGTAVAEIVHQMAPEAQLCLMKVADEVGLERAADEAIAKGARIINHSAIWFGTEFGDGRGVISQIAERAKAKGVLWVNAAGNHAEQHWEGPFRDHNGNGWQEFSGSDETIEIHLEQGETAAIYLTWNSWPKTDQDYDLFLYDSQGRRVAASQRVQTNDEPQERIYYRASKGGTYGIAIYAAHAPSRPDLEIFVHKYEGSSPLNFEYPVRTSSIPAPGNAAGVLTVAAINQSNWQTGPQEWFSSQGPTQDGRLKPDIAGPDGVSNPVYAPFYGTSAAAPHVSGAAALLLSSDPSLTADELRELLEGAALDMGPPGKDTLYGSGRLFLVVGTCPLAPLGRASSPPRDLDNDGLCEDLNGNGRDDFDDAVTLAKNIDAELVQMNWRRFDFNGNGRADLDDATTRARMVAVARTPGAALLSPPASLNLSAGYISAGSGESADTTLTWGIFLDRLPQGLAGYRLTLSLPGERPAKRPAVELAGVEFVAFAGAATVETSPDGHLLTLSATDLEQMVEPGAQRVELARVNLFAHHSINGGSRLELPSLRVESLRLDDDTGLPTAARLSLEPIPGPTTGRLRVTGVLLYPNPLARRAGPGGAARLVVTGQGIEAIALAIYDLSGRRVWESGPIPGRELVWNLTDERGEALANGVYLYIVTVRGANGQACQTKVRKFIISK